MRDVTILFGRPHEPPHAEDRFEIEVLAAEELGIESYAIPLDPVVNGDPERALRRLPRPEGRTWLYRGWMLNEEEYTGLYDAMSERTTIIEINDGGSSVLPEQMDPRDLYKAIVGGGRAHD